MQMLLLDPALWVLHLKPRAGFPLSPIYPARAVDGLPAHFTFPSTGFLVGHATPFPRIPECECLKEPRNPPMPGCYLSTCPAGAGRGCPSCPNTSLAFTHPTELSSTAGALVHFPDYLSLFNGFLYLTCHSIVCHLLVLATQRWTPCQENLTETEFIEHGGGGEWGRKREQSFPPAEAPLHDKMILCEVSLNI